MPFLDLGDVRLCFTDAGEGDPVLLVHGYTADSHDWSWQIPHLLRSHRVLAVDLRGHGSSSVPDEGFTSEAMASDLAALLDHLGAGPVVAIGHSMGASLVSVLAVDRPDLVSAVVAVDPAYLVEDQVVEALGPLVDSLDDDGLVEMVKGIVGEGMDSPARDVGLRTWQVRRVESMQPRVLRDALAVQTSGMALRSQSEPFLRRRQVPVLSFHTDPARAEIERQLFADQRSRTVTWEGAGHWLHQERAPEFNSLVDDWLGSL